MNIPEAFTKEAVAAASLSVKETYWKLSQKRNPYLSLINDNPWMAVPAPDEPLRWDEGCYYDTTVARKHPDWQDKDLPTPTKDINQLRQDFTRWGFCIIEDGLSAEQTERMYERVVEQAEAERALGIANVSESQQNIWGLANKGDVFLRCLTHEPDAVQAGPLIEKLLDEILGPGWSQLSMVANISYPGCHPQGMHQDQMVALACITPDVPVLVNTIYIIEDVDEHNGGTLVIPGSHQRFSEGNGVYGKLPHPVNLEAPAGTIVLKDGRLLHAGAANKSDKLRHIVTNPQVRPFIRHQEAFHLSLRPDILKRASDKLLWRLGFQAHPLNSTVEGYGQFGTGMQGDPNGAIANIRIAMDEGCYKRVGELTMTDVANMKSTDVTIGQIQEQYESAREKTRLLGHKVDASMKNSG